MNDDLLSTREAAEVARCTLRLIQWAALNGKIEALDIGGRYVIRRSEAERYGREIPERGRKRNSQLESEVYE